MVPEPRWRRLGAHADETGVRFGVWAPRATAVAVVGDFNDWEPAAHPLSRGDDGEWHGHVPAIGDGELYQFAIATDDGRTVVKSDPYARFAQLQPQRSSRVFTSRHTWADGQWQAARAARRPWEEPLSIYEAHLGSWRRHDDGGHLTYAELADQLVAHVAALGFTHVELMPVMEHPFPGSWGYQCSGYHAPTSRHGDPDGFRALVDAFHAAGIGVILDWVPGHFPVDEWALAAFDGHALYERELDEEHPEWGTRTFDFARPEVRRFLVENALYWLEEFHADGLRVDAVASLLYLDYGRARGEWEPNRLGGNENLEAIDFLRELNEACHLACPGVVMVAEDSSAWPGVTTPTSAGGLGFGFKQNLGWMHDTLSYLREDPLWRQNRHRELTFPAQYASAENYVLPLSHDEVVHGKGSLVAKFPGTDDEQLATLRAYLALQWAHPGKQLLFMGAELAQRREWSYLRGLDWDLLSDPRHAGVRALVGDLNAVYRRHPALWQRERDGFAWITDHDRQRNVIAFQRRDDAADVVVCVANFAGIGHDDYALGLPAAGGWTVLLDTAATPYGGSGGVRSVDAEAMPHQGCPASATLDLAPLSTLWLAPERG